MSNDTTTNGTDRVVIGYIVGPDEDAVTVCADCARAPESDDYGEIRDGPHYGDRVPYPECYVCGEVMRPEVLQSADPDT